MGLTKLEKYQLWTRTKIKYQTDWPSTVLSYLTLGLVGEAGEVANEAKRMHYQLGVGADKEKLKDELGDVLWYVARLADSLGLTLEELAALNKEKLTKRVSSQP